MGRSFGLGFDIKRRLPSCLVYNTVLCRWDKGWVGFGLFRNGKNGRFFPEWVGLCLPKKRLFSKVFPAIK